MATMTYPSTTSRQTQRNGSLTPFESTAQNSQLSPIPSDPQASSTGKQVATTPQTNNSSNNNNNNQISQSPSRPINHHSLSTSQPASRITSKPATPNANAPVGKDSPGAWKHPKASEIARRQRASNFGPDNVSLIMKSVATCIVVEVLRWTLPNFVWTLLSPISQLTGNVPLRVLQLLVTLTVVFALKPLYFGPDQLLDIDLNATQRSLLGLDPNATPPATPATKYVTPPKYSRSGTPRTGSPASRASSPAGSPLAYKDNTGYRRSSDSFSSSRRASFGSDSRRQSFGLSSSLFGTPSKDGSVFVPQTPSPIGRGSGIPFSSKWRYHKATTSALSRDSF